MRRTGHESGEDKNDVNHDQYGLGAAERTSFNSRLKQHQHPRIFRL